MSTDRTPIDRATDAITRCLWDGANGPHGVARAALSAALTNDADPDWLAKVLASAEEDEWAFEVPEPRASQSIVVSTTLRQYRRQADAVRAAILGEA